MNTTTKKENSDKHPALRPVHLGLFPTLDTLESVVDLGISQLPITSANQLVTVLMTYHNTLLKIQHEIKNQEAAATTAGG